MERLFINNNFHYVTVVPVSNGVGWTTAAMAQQITAFYKARNFNGDGVIVWIDREKREESSQEIYDIIKTSLVSAGAADNRVHVLIADRMSENIILADENLIRQEIGDDHYVYDCEGTHGKHRLSELLKASGKQYKETSTGVSLLKKVRLVNSAEKSDSVARLTATLDLPCWWFKNHLAT